MRVRKSLPVAVALAILTLVSAKAGLPGEAPAGTPELRVPAADNADYAAEPREPPVPAAADNAAATPAGAPGSDNVAESPAGAAGDHGPEEELGATPPSAIADPLEKVNRAIFVFNDKAYFWVLKPIARGYNAVVPQPARSSVRNFFSNLATPIRLVNNLLQGKVKGAGTELLRFGINSTIGMAGLFDPAKTGFHIEKRDEDLGQTMGRYGLGAGFYIVWPLLGPSSARDTVGMAGDAFLDPINYLSDPWVAVGVKAFKTENEVSLSLGDYESLTESALDPYVAVRDAYVQNRAKKVRE